MKLVMASLLLVATLLVAPCVGAQPAAEPVDYSWRMRALDGRTVALEEFRGRVVFLNVWATWCRPCVAELASIQAAADSLAGDDVVFLLVAPEGRRSVERFVRRRGLRLPVLLEHDPIPALFGLRAIPTTYVVGRDGRIALRHRGAAAWDAPAAIAALRSLAAEPAPSSRP